jgi:2-polyprenyl-6-methoxyphenol hydroxylase-like FAD-dependent oxidoreductase
MGGLLAARVLSDFYDAVTVVERDVLPDTPANRRGVPQGRHVHALLGRGSQILDELFPGLLDELVEAGAPVFDYSDLSEAYFSIAGHQTIRAGQFTDIPPLYFPSRPLLECGVRRRVRATANVTVLEGHDVVELAATATGDRITGVRVRPRDGERVDGERVLASDLVIDATGRAARTPAFLEALGYGRPADERVVVRTAYSSCLLRIPPGLLNELSVIVSPAPGRPTGMALFRYEDNTWMLTLIGMAGCEPPTDWAQMLTFAEGFTPPHVLTAIRVAEPLAEVDRHRYPASQWRRYDKMRRFPAGLLVFGDAICSFNPIYGQGMTVAALQALALGDALRRGERGLARRYFHAAAKPIGVAWQFAVGGDLNLPEIEGPRPLSVRIANKYVDRLQAAAETDIAVAEQFAKVIAFIDPPARLLRPSIVVRVAKANRHPRNRRASTDLVEATAG